MIDYALAILYWFARPSIAAWAGAVATVVAVFLAEPRRHLRQPFKFVGRIPRILLCWLILAWFLSQLAGRGSGGSGIGGGRGDVAGPWIHQGTHFGGSALVVRIRFLPQTQKKDLPYDFMCLVRLETETETQEKKIAADSLPEFEQQLHRLFKAVGERPGKVVVERQPFPGEGVLRLIRSHVEAVWPDLIYEEVEP